MSSPAKMDANSEPGGADAGALADGTLVQAHRFSPAFLSALAWIAFISLVCVGLWPILTTTVGGDDFLIPALQYGTGGASFVEALRIGWRGAAAGHFNYAGQIIGAIVGWIWVQATLRYGINFSLVFAVTKLTVYVLTILSAARFVRLGLNACGVVLSAWRARTYVAIALIGTLQIHTAWSNDPTANFPMSGFASAALGFWILSFALGRVLQPSLRNAIEVAIVGLGGILYYEVNAAVVVALCPLIAIGLFGVNRSKTPATWLYAALPLAIPALGAIALRQLTRPEAHEAYSGTAISASSMTSTFNDAMLSSLPGSAWQLTRRWIGQPFAIRALPTLILIGLACVAIGLHRVWGPVRRQRVHSAVTLVGVLAAAALYWTVATAIQAATPKVQAENHGVGFVYNYYAVGATAVAVLIVVASVLVVPRLWPSLRVVGVVGAAGFVIMQVFVTWNLQLRYNESTKSSQLVWAAYANDADEPERCAALDDWVDGPWQPYYRQGLINGLQWAHDAYRGEPYCSEMWDLTTDKPDNVDP